MTDPLSLARMRALRTVAVPLAEGELTLLHETAAAAGRRLIDVTGDRDVRALILGWPTEVDPLVVLSAHGEDLPGAAPTICLTLAACIGSCWTDPETALLPGISVPESQVVDALVRFTRADRSSAESLRIRRANWKSAIRRLHDCGYLVTAAEDSMIRLGPALAGWGHTEIRHLRDRYADLPRPAGEAA